MREVKGRLKDAVSVTRGVSPRRIWQKTVTERRDSGVKLGSLGARFVVRREGNERGRGELLIATNDTSNDAVIDEKSRLAFSSLP